MIYSAPFEVKPLDSRVAAIAPSHPVVIPRSPQRPRNLLFSAPCFTPASLGLNLAPRPSARDAPVFTTPCVYWCLLEERQKFLYRYFRMANEGAEGAYR